MFPPELKSIAKHLVTLYRTFLIADEDGTAVPELLTAEERVVSFVHALGLALLEVFVEVRLMQATAARRPCSCGTTPTVHRTTTWPRQTPFGPLTVRDPYTYCRTCHDSERPLHGLLGTDRETWSLVVQEAAVDLVTDESAGKAVAKLARHHPGVEMDRTTALRMLHDHGKRAREFITRKLAAARKLAELPWGIRGDGAESLEVQWGAGMIPAAALEPIETDPWHPGPLEPHQLGRAVVQAVDDLGEGLGPVVAAVVDGPRAVLVAAAFDAIEQRLDDGALVALQACDAAAEEGAVTELAGDLQRGHRVGEGAVEPASALAKSGHARLAVSRRW